MAAFLLRHRKVSTLGVSGILKDKLEPCRLHVALRLGALAGACNLSREYSTSYDNRANKFDFLDLTCLLWSFEIACMGGGKKAEQGKGSL
uniref:Uncharacterized protein n=1 Tax=Salix viminalis TaxID=40686 RepID=A0A6N2MUX2_SALVM